MFPSLAQHVDAPMCTLRPQCRLEANYAHQQKLDMIPLMMQKDYAPKGWRKIVTMQSVAFATTPFSQLAELLPLRH